MHFATGALIICIILKKIQKCSFIIMKKKLSATLKIPHFWFHMAK